MNNHVTRLDFAERWLRDGLAECGHAGAFESIDADAETGSAILKHYKAIGLSVTWTHIFVRAAALVLSRHPELHSLVAGNTRVSPSTVDICLSVGGDSSVTPVLIVEDAANKNLRAIAAEVIRRTPEAADEARKMQDVLRRFGWVIPFAGWRRMVMGFLLRRPWYRRKASGTFQVSCVPQVDVFAPFIFNTSAVLGVGRVMDKVVAVNGKAVVRPMVTLTCCIDHSVWNGMAAAKFLTALRTVIESGEFVENAVASEAPALAASAR